MSFCDYVTLVLENKSCYNAPDRLRHSIGLLLGLVLVCLLNIKL